MIRAGIILLVLFFSKFSLIYGGVNDELVPYCVGAANVKDHTDVFKRHHLVQKMSEGIAQQVKFTPEEFAKASVAKIEDSRFSWGRLRKQSQHLAQFASFLKANRSRIFKESIARV